MITPAFRGELGFLSNFYECYILYEGEVYPSVEVAFQAAKCADPEVKKTFLTMNGREAKAAGKKVAARKDWDEVKLDIMEELCSIKFSLNPNLQEKLLLTGDKELVETNWWHDTYWGVCNGVGHNHLGKILMKIRAKLREEIDPN